MRTSSKFISVLICIILISLYFTPVLAEDSPTYTVAIPNRFDGDAFRFYGGLATVQNGGKYGLIDKTGKVIIDFVYDAPLFSYPDASQGNAGNYFIAIKNEKWGVIDLTGKPLTAFTYDSIQITNAGLAVVGKGKTTRPGPGSIDGVWGVIDLSTGREILPVKYTNISTSNDSSRFIVFQGKPVEYNVGMTDRSGELLIPLKYDSIVHTDNWRLFIVTLGARAGLLDRNGKSVVPLGTYEYIGEYKYGFALVKRNGKFGVIDNTGKVVIPVIYNNIKLRNGQAVVVKDNKYGAINTSGKQIIPFDYDYGGHTENGAIFMRHKSKTTIFDSFGKIIAPAGKFDNAYVGVGQIGNLVFVESKGKIGAIDMTGKQVIPLIYTGVREAKNGLAIVNNKDKSAVINQSGIVVLPLEKYGLINLLEDGNIIVVSPVTGWGLKDRSGKTILPCEYWGIGSMKDNYVVANNKKGYAIFDKDGNMIVPFGEFDYIGYHINENMVDVRKNGLTGYISLPQYVEKPDAWARPEIDRAISAGLVPEEMRKNYRDNITRADFCRLAINLIETKIKLKIDQFMNNQDMSDRVAHPLSFTDTNDPYVLAASSLGIVKGIGNDKFDPNGKITRQDAAIMLRLTARVLDFTEPQGTTISFADSDKFASYAVNSIAFVSTASDKESGIRVMAGTGNNNFSPYSNYTRQQAYITMLRLFNAIN